QQHQAQQQQVQQPNWGGQPQQAPPPASDPGNTAVHQRFDAAAAQRPDDTEGTEGVRIIKP
ncbi:hypothetical protein ACFQZ2_16320, partial [Streptomonospora algeriensis]